jgi:hypothetical protein
MLRDPTRSLDDVTSYVPLGSDAKLAEKYGAAGGRSRSPLRSACGPQGGGIFPAWVDHPPSVSCASGIKCIP